MSEEIAKIAEKLKNLRESIINGQTTDEEVIKEKLNAIRVVAEQNGVNFVIDDEEYIRYLQDTTIGEESDYSEEESSEEEDYDD